MGAEIAFRLRDIIVVELRESTDTDGDPCYRLHLGLRTGPRLPLHSMDLYGREGCEAEKERIRQFVGLS